MLSVGKVSAAPKFKGKKGKQKGKQKSGEDSQAVYVGDNEGRILCILAFGEDSIKKTTALTPARGTDLPLVDFRRLKPRVGQHDTLYWSENSFASRLMERIDSSSPYVFPYNTSAYSKDFTSMSHLQEFVVGDFVSLLLRVIKVEERYTGSDQKYLLIQGIDADGSTTGGMCMWRFEEGDIQPYHIYFFRGMKVRIAQVWSDITWTYDDREDKQKDVECTRRTAVEDVTEVSSIRSFYRS